MKIKSIQQFNNSEDIISFSIYSDTDSIFYPLEPLIFSKYGTLEMDDAEFIEKSKPLITEVQNFINESYNVYAEKFHNVKDHGWNIKQELIARRGFWSGKEKKLSKTDKLIPNQTKIVDGVKKRYAQWIVNKEGVPKDYMDVKGLESVRSNFPKKFRSDITAILKALLHDCSESEMNKTLQKFKREVMNCDISDIMIPTGVSSITEYTTDQISQYDKGTPAHVKAALNFNSLIKQLNLEQAPLTDGDKVVWGYLVDNPYKFDALALSRDNNPKEIVEYVHKYIDKNKIFEQLFIGKIQAYYDSMGWKKVQLTTHNFF